MKRALSKDEKEGLVADIASFFSHQDDVVAVYLFGSFLGEGPFSDIDLAVLLKRPMKRPLNLELSLENTLERIAGYPVDVRVLNMAPLAFCQSVFKTGRVISDLDPNFRSDFQGRMLKEYYDFSPFHRQYLREVMNAPV